MSARGILAGVVLGIGIGAVGGTGAQIEGSRFLTTRDFIAHHDADLDLKRAITFGYVMGVWDSVSFTAEYLQTMEAKAEIGKALTTWRRQARCLQLRGERVGALAQNAADLLRRVKPPNDELSAAATLVLAACEQ